MSTGEGENKLRLSVLDLTHIELATEEDKHYQIDHWASLFKATTWEELNILAQNNEDIAEASETVYQLSQEERIRLECEAREDYYRTQPGIQNMLDSQKAEIETLTEENKSLADEINRLHAWMKQHGHDPAEI